MAEEDKLASQDDIDESDDSVEEDSEESMPDEKDSAVLNFANNIEDPLATFQDLMENVDIVNDEVHFRCGPNNQEFSLIAMSRASYSPTRDILRNDLLPTLLKLSSQNTQHMYEQSSWGWKEQDKVDELMDDHARFLLVYEVKPPDDTGVLKEPDLKGFEPVRQDIAAFLHYRFVYEFGRPVLYVYDVQVDNEYQRLGLGTFLMQVSIVIGRAADMRNVVLTVFRFNKPAMDFYLEKLKFQVDPESPSQYGIEMDYEILSLNLKQRLDSGEADPSKRHCEENPLSPANPRSPKRRKHD